LGTRARSRLGNAHGVCSAIKVEQKSAVVYISTAGSQMINWRRDEGEQR
jgi:hypothetical protein